MTTSNPATACFQPNADELAGRVAHLLRNALAPLAPRIEFAALFGSIAKGTARANSDVDVLIVSDAYFDEVMDALAETGAALERTISPLIYAPEYFVRQRAKGLPFLIRVLEGKHIVLMGAADAIDAK